MADDEPPNPLDSGQEVLEQKAVSWEFNKNNPYNPLIVSPDNEFTIRVEHPPDRGWKGLCYKNGHEYPVPVVCVIPRNPIAEFIYSFPVLNRVLSSRVERGSTKLGRFLTKKFPLWNSGRIFSRNIIGLSCYSQNNNGDRVYNVYVRFSGTVNGEQTERTRAEQFNLRL